MKNVLWHDLKKLKKSSPAVDVPRSRWLCLLCEANQRPAGRRLAACFWISLAARSKYSKSSPNPPTQLVSIVLNIVPHKKKAELAGELMRREEKTWRNQVSCKKPCLHENQDKKRELERNRREKRYDWITIYFEETIHWRYSFYEYCLYDMVSIETASGFLGWDWPKRAFLCRGLIFSPVT